MTQKSKTLSQKLKRPRAHKKMTTSVSLTNSAQTRLDQLSLTPLSDSKENYSSLLEELTILVMGGCGLYFIVTMFVFIIYCVFNDILLLLIRSSPFRHDITISHVDLWTMAKDFYSSYYGIYLAIVMIVGFVVGQYFEHQRFNAKKRVV